MVNMLTTPEYFRAPPGVWPLYGSFHINREYMTIEGYRGPEAVLLSYDVSGEARSTAARVCQIVFGRARLGPKGERRDEPGYVHRPGVVWVGQSVLLLPQADAAELAGKLRRLGVRVAMGRVRASREAIEAFRRPR